MVRGDAHAPQEVRGGRRCSRATGNAWWEEMLTATGSVWWEEIDAKAPHEVHGGRRCSCATGSAAHATQEVRGGMRVSFCLFT